MTVAVTTGSGQAAWQLTRTADDVIYLVPAGTKIKGAVKTVNLGSGLNTIQSRVMGALLDLHASQDQVTMIASNVMGGRLGSVAVGEVDDKLHWLSSGMIAALGDVAFLDTAAGAGAAAGEAEDGAGAAGAAEGGAAGTAGGTAASKLGASAGKQLAKDGVKDLTEGGALAAFIAGLWSPLRIVKLIGGLVLAFLALHEFASIMGATDTGTVSKLAAAAVR